MIVKRDAPGQSAGLALACLALLAGWLLVGCDGPDAGGRSIFNTSGLSGKPAEDEEQLTILLYVLSGPDHVRQAKRYLQQTQQHTGWDDVYVVHKQDHSELYRGHYRVGDMDSAQRDMMQAKKWRSPAGVPLFAQAIIKRLPGKDLGPPEFRTDKAQGFWTVLVGVYFANPDIDFYARKQAAVDHCVQLRKQGQEAYYHHGPSKSYVVIGAFPESAVQMVLVNRVHQPEIRDPRMKAIIAAHPKLAVNGYSEIIRRADPRTGQVVEVETGTYPIEIPGRTRADDAPANHPAGYPQPR